MDLIDDEMSEKLDNISVAKSPIQGTHWYTVLANPEYSQMFSYYSLSTKDRNDLIVDDDSDEVTNDIDHCPNTAITDRPVDDAGCGNLQIVDPANFNYISSFTMPEVSTSTVVDLFEFTCASSNAGPRCNDVSNTVYVVPNLPPVAGASDDTEDQTVDVGSTVTVVCSSQNSRRTRE